MRFIPNRAAVLLLVVAAACGCATERPVSGASADRSKFGVLVMAHGGSQKWNDTVLAAVAPLRKEYPVDVAFGMADAASLQSSVSKLEAQGVRRIAVIRLFVSGESWYERTSQILGVIPGAPIREVDKSAAGAGEHEHHVDMGHSMEFWLVKSSAAFTLSKEGLADAPEMNGVLSDRAKQLSRDPNVEDILIVAHGPGDDAENARWITKINERANSLRTFRAFRRVEVQTLREDWPEKRVAAEERIRAFVKRAKDENGRAIVIPFRVEGFGPYESVLKGLEFIADGQGLLPHDNVGKWIERQITEIEASR